MDRVKDYIGFTVWFIGLSYVALWPTAVPDSITLWLAPPGRPPLACGGPVVAPLQALCRVHETVALPPGLHLIGTLAAFWVTARLMMLLCVRIARAVVPPAVRSSLSSARLTAILRRPLMRLRGSGPEPPPRYVPRRRDFGLRGTPR